MASGSTRPRSTSLATQQGRASAARLTHAIATTSRGTPGSRDPKIERCRIPTNSPPTGSMFRTMARDGTYPRMYWIVYWGQSWMLNRTPRSLGASFRQMARTPTIRERLSCAHLFTVALVSFRRRVRYTLTRMRLRGSGRLRFHWNILPIWRNNRQGRGKTYDNGDSGSRPARHLFGRLNRRTRPR